MSGGIERLEIRLLPGEQIAALAGFRILEGGGDGRHLRERLDRLGELLRGRSGVIQRVIGQHGNDDDRRNGHQEPPKGARLHDEQRLTPSIGQQGISRTCGVGFLHNQSILEELWTADFLLHERDC